MESCDTEGPKRNCVGSTNVIRLSGRWILLCIYVSAQGSLFTTMSLIACARIWHIRDCNRHDSECQVCETYVTDDITLEKPWIQCPICFEQIFYIEMFETKPTVHYRRMTPCLRNSVGAVP